MKSFDNILVALSVLFSLGCSARGGMNSQVITSYKTAELSKTFTRVRAKGVDICIQRTEMPQWLYDSIAVGNPGFLPASRHLQTRRDEVAKYIHDLDQDLTNDMMIGPFLPMGYMDLRLAVKLANAASERYGLPPAYEVTNEQGGEVFKFRRTGESGFRLPTVDEWKTIAPHRWHQKSHRFRCMHANTGGDLLAAYQSGQGMWDLPPTETLWQRRVSCADGYTWLAPVASYKPTRKGLYDVWGNAAEVAEPPLEHTDADRWWNGSLASECGVSMADGVSDIPADTCYFGDESTTPVLGVGVRLVIEPTKGKCPTLDPKW